MARYTYISDDDDEMEIELCTPWGRDAGVVPPSWIMLQVDERTEGPFDKEKAFRLTTVEANRRTVGTQKTLRGGSK